MHLSNPRAVVVYNPTAGRFPSRLLTERAAVVLQKAGWQVQLEQSQDSQHIYRLASQAAAQGVDYFLVAGGDGSVNQAVTGLAGSDTALGVLPAGTANVWAQELGLPGLTWTRWMALEESARLLAAGRVCRIDVGLCNRQPFLLWAGLGLDAFVVHRIEPRPRWEKNFAVVQYAASVVWHAAYWRGVQMQVEADGEVIAGHFILALVSNVHLYAGGLANLSPQARLDDGRMDLWLFEGETLGDTVQRAIDLFSGGHLTSDKVQQRTFSTLAISSASPAYVQLDGEPVDITAPLVFSVWPKSLNVLVPQVVPQPLLTFDDHGAERA